MFALRLTLVALLFVPVALLAHQINGTLQESSGRPLQQEKVIISCSLQGVPKETSTATDSRGSFSLFIPQTGRCVLSVREATYTIYSSQNPVRYDLVLDNKTLRRH